MSENPEEKKMPAFMEELLTELKDKLGELPEQQTHQAQELPEIVSRILVILGAGMPTSDPGCVIASQLAKSNLELRNEISRLKIRLEKLEGQWADLAHFAPKPEGL